MNQPATTATPRFYVAPYYADPDNSASVFERGRVNEFGERYCIQPGLTYKEAREMARRLNRAALGAA